VCDILTGLSVARTRERQSCVDDLSKLRHVVDFDDHDELYTSDNLSLAERSTDVK
jgi:hypothetical protein